MRSQRFGSLGSNLINRAASAVVEELEGRQLLSATTQTLLDGDGDRVTISVTNGGTIAPLNAIRNIEVSGTNVNSVLTISIVPGVHGNGLVQLGEIRCYGPMRVINAPHADISHELTTNDKNLPVSPTDKIWIKLGAMKGVAMYTGGQRVSTLTVADWSMRADGQELNAPSVDTFVITGRKDVPGTAANEALPGNSGEVMYLGDSSTTVNTVSLGSLSVAGTMGEIQATGRIGNITAHAIHGLLQATSFGNIVTGSITGNIEASGARGIATAIASLRVTGSATSLVLSTDQGDIGPVTILGRMVSSVLQSASGLQNLTVGGSLMASRVQTRGDVGSVTVGSLTDAEIQVGVSPAFAGLATSASAFVNPAATLNSLTVTGIASQPATQSWIVTSNTISAPHMGALTLRNLDTSSALRMYVHDASSPAQVRYYSAVSPSSNFLWQPGTTMPALLAAVLRRV